MTVAAALLVGGRGTRLAGAAKPLLTIDGARIVDRLIAVLAPLVDEVLLVGGDARYEGLGARAVPDLRPGCGPLAGLEAAFTATAASEVLLAAGDMPFVSGPVVALLLRAAPGADAAVPFVGGRPEPLLARYHRRIADRVRARLDRGQRAAHGLLEEIAFVPVEEAALRAVDPALRAFTNVNTPDELARAAARE